MSGLAGSGRGLLLLGFGSMWCRHRLQCRSSSFVLSFHKLQRCLQSGASSTSGWFGLSWSVAYRRAVGSVLIALVDPRAFKLGVGLLLLVFPAILYLNPRPLALTIGGRSADTAIGFAGGMLGGLAGLSGPIPTLWASVRGWGKNQRRGVFQAFNWTMLTYALCLQASAGLMTEQVVRFALFALPGTIFGAWLGARTYRILSDRHFHNVVLGLLFLSGTVLVCSNLFVR